MRTPKNFRTSLTADEGSIALLDAIAEEYDGNRSFTMRRVLREAAERRGIVVAGKPETDPAEGMRDERATA